MGTRELAGGLAVLMSLATFGLICTALRARDPWVWACTIAAWLITAGTVLVGPAR
jgi:hypothetical protein